MVWLVRRMLLSLVALAALVVVASAETASAAPPASTAGPATVLAAPSAGSISAGQNFTCGVRTEGTLACWGDNALGQSTPPGGNFRQVSSGSAFACGIKTDRTLICWGDDGERQVSDTPGGMFTQVSAGGFHACGLKTDGTVTCWGYNFFGQASPPGGTFIQISSGGFHTCGLKDDGTVTCWGYSRFGQASAPAGSFTQVSSGDLHTCAVQAADANLACWGQLSLGRSTPPAGPFSQVSAGESHTCGVQSDANLACWGYNAFGQATPPAGAFTEVSAGGSHTCGVETDGTVACWGADGFHQVTDTPTGTFTPKGDTTPPVITLPADIVAEATGPGGAVVTYAVTAADPDDAATVACTPASGGTFPVGVTTVACTATDTNGNAANGSFTVTVQDTTAPSITLPANISAEATGPSGAPVTYTAPTATDTVDGSVTPSCSPASGSTFALGSTTVTCTATDTNGNTANGAFTVTVRDTTPPVVTITVTSPVEATGPSGAAVTYTASAIDIVDGSVPTSCAPASGSIFPLGNTTISCTATDAAGTTGSANATVLVEDETAPTLSLPADITTAATSASGAVVTYSVSATDPDNLASDLTISCTPASGSTFTTGATTVTCKATDPAGNSSTGSFQVNVVDFSMGAISPVTVPVGGTASAAVPVTSVSGFNSAVALSASGAPAGVSVTFNPSSVTPPSGGSASSTLTLQLSPMVTPTTFTLTITGTFEGVSHSTVVSVTVTVSSAAIADVIGQLVVAVCIDNTGVANALTSKLTAEQGAIAGGHRKTAINILKAFSDQVKAQSGKHISVTCTIEGVTFDAALVLITDARSLIDSIAVSATPNPITGSVHTAAGAGVAGAILTLKDSSGAPLATATTDITGFYFFATTGVLTPGETYTVTVTVPIGLAVASPDTQTFTWSGNGEVALAAFTTV